MIEDHTLRTDYVLVGKVCRAHGIKGEVKIYPFSQSPENFVHYKELLLVDLSGRQYNYPIVRARSHERLAIIALDGVSSRDKAEELVGSEVWIRKESLPKIGPNEFYWQDMVGMAVFTTEGQGLGTIKSIFAAGVHDVFVVSGHGKEFLIPAQEEFIEQVDTQAKKMVVRTPPGLLEIND